MIKGIDVSSHDNFNGSEFKANTESCYRDSDFVIAKATQGVTYVHKQCDAIINRAKNDGKLWGFYHYAGGNDPIAEAEFFYAKCRGYFGSGVPCLDWESIQNKAWGNSNWCRKFVDKIHELTGVWCLIYVQASAISQVANCADDCGLWVAGYPDNRNSWDMPNFRYGTNPWKTWTIWQYSSSNGATDRNYAQLNREGWLKIAAGSGEPVTPEPAKPFNGAIGQVQAWCGAYADGIYGPNTKKCLLKVLQSELNKQFGRGLAVDGIWGPKTRAACVNVRQGARGNITKVLQGALICNGYDTNGFDGIFGAATKSAVRQYQAANGLSEDGVAGKNTFAKLFG
nr:MAG TPA: lysozyme family protein [Caudoviricetes sp.]